MKNHIFKIAGLGCLAMALSFTSCEDFLDRPTTDNYTCADFYKTPEQLRQAANTLYGTPWFDYQRGLIWVLEPLAGNYYNSDAKILPFLTLSTSDLSTNDYLIGMSNSTWAVIAHANQTIDNINLYTEGVDQTVKDKYIAECMVFKAMAYFEAVRIWGSIPIIHSTSKTVAAGEAFEMKRNKKEDVYKYIISTLIEASEYLPETRDAGRVDKYSVYGLLAKVYLQAAGVTGTLNTAYLQKSKDYAAKVYEKYSSYAMLDNYEDLWRISTGDNCSEGLITLHWNAIYDPYTAINAIHCDINMGSTFSGTAGWGSGGGPSIDLQNVFGVSSAFKPSGTFRSDTLDQRRRGNMLLYKDHIWYWWRDSVDATLKAAGLTTKGFYASWNYGDKVDATHPAMLGAAESSCVTGAQCVKYIFGNVSDHVAECGITPQSQGSNVPIHLLRTADVLLCYAQADFELNGSVTGDALAAWNLVQKRAYRGNESLYKPAPTTYKEFFDERRRELAFEGENWFDLVTVAYFNPEVVESYLQNEERGSYNQSFPSWYRGELSYGSESDFVKAALQSKKYFEVPTNQSKETYCIPYSQNDFTSNPNLREPAVDYDFSQVSYYDESKI